jgi:hypothetical protein
MMLNGLEACRELLILGWGGVVDVGEWDLAVKCVALPWLGVRFRVSRRSRFLPPPLVPVPLSLSRASEDGFEERMLVKEADHAACATRCRC